MVESFTTTQDAAPVAAKAPAAGTGNPPVWRVITTNAGFPEGFFGAGAKLIHLPQQGSRSFALIGGDGGISTGPTVFWSEDAATWEPESVPFPARSNPAVSHLGNAGILLFGGSGANGLLGDIWCWAGSNWMPIPRSNPAPAARHFAGGVSASTGHRLFGNWIIGGGTGDDTGDVWWSENGGCTWHPMTQAAPWAPLEDAAVVYTDAGIWMFGGTRDAAPVNEVWMSEDGGATWARQPDPPWDPRTGAVAAVISDGIVVIGGINEFGAVNETWIMADDWRVGPPPPEGVYRAPCACAGRSVVLAGVGVGFQEVWALDCDSTFDPG